MKRKRKRFTTTIAITLSVLMGTQAALPAYALADETGDTPEVVLEPYEPQETAYPPLMLIAAADSKPREVGRVTFGDAMANTVLSPVVKNLALLKGMGFTFGETILPIQAWQESDGTKIYAININKNNAALWKDIMSGKTTVWDNAKKRFSSVNTRGNKFKFSPYFEVTALCKSKDKDTWGEAVVFLGIKGSKEGQYYIFTGEVSFMGGAGAKVPFRYSENGGASFDGALVIAPRLTPKLAGGVGAAYIGRVGFYGTGTLSAEATVLPKKDAGWDNVTLKANIGVEVVALGFQLWSKDIWKGGPWDLIQPRKKLKTQSEDYDIRPLFAIESSGDTVIRPLRVMSDSSGTWQGNIEDYVDAPYLPDGGASGEGSGDVVTVGDMTNESSTPQVGPRLLKTDIYPDAQIEIAEVPGGAVMCWLEPATDVDNVSRLMWSRYDSATDVWSDPKPVNTADDAETADYEPDLFTDKDGTVHAAWLSAPSDIASTAMNLKTVTERLEVRYAKLEAGADDFTAPEVVAPSYVTTQAEAEAQEEAERLAAQAEAEEALKAAAKSNEGADDAAGTRGEVSESEAETQIERTDADEETEAGDTLASDLTFEAADDKTDSSDVQEYAEAADALVAQADGEPEGPQITTLVAQSEDTDGYFRTKPKVAAAADEVLIGWSTTPLHDVTDFDGDHQVIVAQREVDDNGNVLWSAADAPSFGSEYEITSLDAGLLEDTPSIAWTVDDLHTNDEGTTESGPNQAVVTWKKYGDNGGLYTAKRAANVDFVSKNGEGVLTWAEPNDSDTCTVKLLSGNSVENQITDVSLPASYQIDGDLATTALISYPQWEANEEDVKSSGDLYGRLLENGDDISEENLLVAHSDDITSHDVAFEDGKPLVALAAERGVGEAATDIERSADLLVAKGDSLERLAICDLIYDETEVKPGETVNAKVIVRNAGLVPITDGVYAEIIDDETDTLLGKGYLDEEIAVDDEAAIPVQMKVPADFDPDSYRDISVKTNFQLIEAKDSTALNLDTVLIGQSVGDPDDDGKDDGGKDDDKDKGQDDKHDRRPTPPRVRPANGGSWPWGGIHYYGGGYSSSGTGNVQLGETTTTTTTSVSTNPAKATGSSKVERRAGANRYQTMKETVLAAFNKSEVAILASGETFADALSAQALAGIYKAPVILTEPGRLSPEAKETLEALGCKRVIVAGGASAVSDAALDQARAITGDAKRVAGPNRYQTSLAIMREVLSAGSTGDTVFVTTGTNFADALSAGPASWKLTSPVLLVDASKVLSADAVAAIKANPSIKRVALVGGDAVVSDAVKEQLGGGYDYIRLSGDDRYQTSAAVAAWAGSQGLGWTRPHVATGRNFADALSGAASAGASSSCLLLADGTSSPALSELKKHANEVSKVTLLGGTQAVSPDIEGLIDGIVP